MITLFFGAIFVAITWSWNWMLGAALTIVVLLILILPVEGFEKKKQIGKDIHLLKLKRGSKEDTYYVETKHNKAIYAYDNSEAYNLFGGAYEENYRKGDIKVYESEQCKSPILRDFVTKPSREFFTFAPFSTKREYVFYVPEGTVLNSQDKHKATMPETDVV
ncbi:MAG: hypothetical protein IJ272_09290 [Clostridia bacterium]|nr:hypothetical protein [Clostridia bacterium]